MSKSIVVALVSSIVALCVSPAPGGSNPYSVTASPGKITVVPSGGWHINEDYPWIAKGKTGSSHKFSLSWNAAVATGVPSGPVKVKGGVCNANTCTVVAFDTTVP